MGVLVFRVMCLWHGEDRDGMERPLHGGPMKWMVSARGHQSGLGLGGMGGYHGENRRLTIGSAS